MERPTILAIDFNNCVFGSYYGEEMLNSYGMNVNAIRGFFFKIKQLRDMFNPDYIIFASDLHRDKTFRRKLYKPYKAHRKPKDEDIVAQLQRCRQIVELLGFPLLNNELYEADDILGMISTYTNEADMNFIMVSSDKDLYQLLTDTTMIYSIRNRELLDRQWLWNKYKLTTNQWIELKILQGDKSDNIPGIDGIGEVTGIKMLHAFGDLNGVYQNLKHMKPVLRDRLIDHIPFLDTARQLVTILTDPKLIEFNPSMLQRKEVWTGEVYQVLEELELYSLNNVMRYSLLLNKEELML